jgi:DNA-binding response OmpR family regulator
MKQQQQQEDAVVFETLLTKIIDALKSALGNAETARRILSTRRRSGGYVRRSDVAPANLVDDGRFTVRWNGDECHLGSTVLFRLFCRLALSANEYVSVGRLMEDVWPGPRSEEAVRSAVRNLRRKLEEAGMAELAEAIKTQPGHYGLRLDGIALKVGLHRESTAVAPPVHGPAR